MGNFSLRRRDCLFGAAALLVASRRSLAKVEPASDAMVSVEHGIAVEVGGLVAGQPQLARIRLGSDVVPHITLDGASVITLPTAVKREWVALLAIGVEAGLSDRRLTLDAGTTRTVVLPARAGVYDQRALSVPPRYVTPNAKDRKRAAEEAKALSEVLRHPHPARLFDGAFYRPVDAPETSPFGTLRTYNGKSKSRHMGWDLDGAVGDPVCALGAGRCVLAADRYYSGGTVVLDHGRSLFSLYFHLSRLDVRQGDVVAKAARIGAVGATGRVTGPHLHLAVKLYGDYIDPQALLALPMPEAEHPPR